MAEKRTIELEVKESGFKSLKAQIKEANIELIKAQENFGDYSKEALKAAQNVAGLKDKIAEAGETAALFDPGKKFQVASGAITAAAGAVSAYQGAMGLLGVESAAVEEAMLRVQSAMALSQGLSSIADSRKDFERLAAMLGITRKARIVDAAATATQATVTTAATAATGKMTIAQRLLNLVMKANPIFLIIGGIAALVGAYALFGGSQEDAAEKVSKLNEKLEEQNKFVEYQKKSIDDITALELARARERGASEEELIQIKKNSVDEQVDLAYTNYIETQKTYDKIWELRKKDKATDEEYNEIKKKEQESYDKWQDAQTKRRIADAERDADKAEKDREDIAKKAEIAQQKADAAAQKRADKRKADLDEISKFVADASKANLDAAKTDQQVELDNIELKYKEQIALATKYKKDTTQLIEAQKNEQNLVNTKYAQIEIDIEQAKQDKLDAINADQKVKLQELTFTEQEQLAAKYAQDQLLYADNQAILLALKDKYIKDSEAIQQAANDKELADARAVVEQKAAIQMQGLDVALQGVQLIKGVFEQQKGIQKAAVIAESAIGIAKMIIANKLANVAALATPQAIATSGAAAVPVIALNNISTGIGIAANIAATGKALKTLGGGTAPTAPPTGGGGGGAGGVSAPNFNIVGNSGINQLAELGGQPIQAYVVSGEVTSAQALDRNRIQNATF